MCIYKVYSVVVQTGSNPSFQSGSVWFFIFQMAELQLQSGFFAVWSSSVAGFLQFMQLNL
jgi:hypothetical protein